MDAPERYEQLLAFLGSNLPAPVHQYEDADGSIHFVGGDPPEVLVVLTDANVVVSEHAIVWRARGPQGKPRRVGVLKWRRLPETALFNALGTLIKGARDARRAQFRVCHYCGRSTAPEAMQTDSLCQSCAQREVVH